MKSALEDVSSVKKKLRIEVSPDDVKKEREKTLADIARTAKIPGFRPGKAPKAVVERRYGDEVRNDVMHRLITDAYLKAVQEHGISPVDVPEISDVSDFSLSSDAPLSFTAVVEVRPVIELGRYDGIEVKEPDATVSDEEVEQAINRLREMYAHLEVVEGRPAEKGDALIIDFEGFREGKPIDGARAADFMLTLGAGNLIPGFEEQLAGMNKGETKDVRVTFPADYANKEVAGTEASFTVTVKEIKRAVLSELNDEFAKDVGRHETVAELRAGIREDIEARKKSEGAAAQRDELLAKLVDAHSFDAPPGMVENELRSLLRQQLARMARQGMDFKSVDPEKFRIEYRPFAERRVKVMLLLDAIAEKEGVTVSDEELATDIVALARGAGRPVEEVRQYYDAQEGGLEGLRASLIRDKTLNLLLSRAKKSYN